MPLYIYKCGNCNCEQEQFLRTDKQAIPIQCKRCLKQTIAHQVRDRNMQYKQQGDVVGIVKRERATTSLQKS